MNMKKTALITGATRGIGKQIALKLAKENYNIIINYRTRNEELESTIKEIESNNVDCLALQGDVSKYEDCENIVKQTIEKFGKIDVLVNNAGITKDMLLMRMKKEDFQSVIDVNLVGTFNVTKNVIPYMMKAHTGRIINISSVVGVTGNAGQTNYSASKAGIIGFTKSLAKEVASRNILVNAIAPGFIETDMTSILKEEIKENIANQIPLKKMGTAQDVANLVKFLSSDDSSYITGQVINVDGGMVM
ncbi:MAG TPA: 3-oxoacyl-[acyl-carrier-protein] reductase [Clostridia bacterium]|nr:3-oxoacyl-[acyl-carrier-protein] reductase [Clostridia bacterium]